MVCMAYINVLYEYTTLIISPPGAFISPNGYTLIGVMSVNGSDPNGGCPTHCVGVANGIKRCDCADTRDVTETGFLVYGIVSTINASQSGGTWASLLYTNSAAMTTYRIVVQIPEQCCSS